MEDGTVIDFRALSRSEAVTLRSMTDEAASELFMLRQATDSTEEEAIAFYDAVTQGEGAHLLQAVAILSGLATAESIAEANAGTVKEAPDPKPPTNEPS